ncbi:MAG: TonB-dependent receptor, partial [Chitinophagaceae bacterium]|nr:TonB-dependent receptor [Chitinophagaceae bacterium]
MTGVGKFLLFALTVLLFCGSAISQRNLRITGNFSNIRFNEFVHRIEASSGYQFFYREQELDTFKVDISVTETPFSDLLRQIFQNTTFYFSIDTVGHVFILRNYSIQTSLPEGFFNSKINLIDTSRNIGTPFIEVTSKKIKSRSVENRLFEIGARMNNPGKGTAVISGYVRDSKTGEPITGAAVFVDTSTIGATTDHYGYYTLTVPKGRNTLHISAIGMKDSRYQMIVYSDGKLDIDLQEFVPTLKEVVVVSERHSNVMTTQMGVERLTIKTIKQVPVVLGEVDVLRVLLTLPGVTTVGEATTGFNVRGGSTDQNLILFSDATIYNPSHLFGFFSAFNPDVVKGVELYKSG